jgi:hypothetical protein
MNTKDLQQRLRDYARDYTGTTDTEAMIREASDALEKLAAIEAERVSGFAWTSPDQPPPVDPRTERFERSAVCYISKLDGKVSRAVYDKNYDAKRGGFGPENSTGWIEINESAAGTGEHLYEPIVAWMRIQERPTHPAA